MDPQLNEQDQDAADDAAFEKAAQSVIQGQTYETLSAGPAQGDIEQPAATEAPAAAAPAPAAPVVEDPYAGLPPAVRDALALLPALQHELKTTNGRVGALQRELATRQSQAAAPAPAPAEPRTTKRDAVRSELPEVADAIDEGVEAAVQRLLATAPPAAPAPARVESDSTSSDDDEATLLGDLGHGDWATKVESTEYKLWLGRQPADYQARIRDTSKAAVLAAALNKFDQFSTTVAARTAAAVDAAGRRNDRAARAVQPSGAGARPAVNTQPTEDEAFERGFKLARGG